MSSELNKTTIKNIKTINESNAIRFENLKNENIDKKLSKKKTI